MNRCPTESATPCWRAVCSWALPPACSRNVLTSAEAGHDLVEGALRLVHHDVHACPTMMFMLFLDGLDRGTILNQCGLDTSSLCIEFINQRRLVCTNLHERAGSHGEHGERPAEVQTLGFATMPRALCADRGFTGVGPLAFEPCGDGPRASHKMHK